MSARAPELVAVRPCQAEALATSRPELPAVVVGEWLAVVGELVKAQDQDQDSGSGEEPGRVRDLGIDRDPVRVQLLAELQGLAPELVAAAWE